jgi:hypothetical protein
VWWVHSSIALLPITVPIVTVIRRRTMPETVFYFAYRAEEVIKIKLAKGVA